MTTNQLETFIDRREAIALFNHLRGRDPSKPWRLLPILAFIAPGGSGKSTLIEYLRTKELQGAVPSAQLDFTLASTPKDLLLILVNIRDQLQQQDDGQGKHLLFPRFDLGAAITLAASTLEDVALLAPNQVRSQLAAGKQVFESLSALGSTLGYTVPYIAPLLAGLKLAGQIKPLHNVLGYLENNSGWKWYRMHGTTTGLRANASMKDVLLRLHLLSIPGATERQRLIEEVLPAAFLADLLDTLVHTSPARAWSSVVNVVLFLDGFEALLATSSTTAMRLLRVLTTEPIKSGTTSPMMLVVGSRDRLPGLAEIEQDPPFEQRTVQKDERGVQQQARELYEHWYQHLLPDKRFLRLTDLYLHLVLGDFGFDDTRSYLLKSGEREQTQVFAEDEVLVQKIDRITHGHPLFLALATTAVLEARARGRHMSPDELEHEAVSTEIVPDHEDDERIGDYLLDLYLRQLPQSEQKDLIFCAAPRFLDTATLRAVLQLPSDVEARERWLRYRRYTFMRALDEERLIFHPIVRQLLQQHLPPNHDPQSDYYRTHSRLQEHFHHHAEMEMSSTFQSTSIWHPLIEEAYHALALGKPEFAINLGSATQQREVSIWKPLLNAVTQAPTGLIPQETEHWADIALRQASLHYGVQNGVTAIILYTWQLAVSYEDTRGVASLVYKLGMAYSELHGEDQQANLEQAIRCYTQALEIYTRETFPIKWAAVQNHLGAAYSELPGGDRQANLEQAIHCFTLALEVYTRKAFPRDWAGAQNNVGNAYSELPGGDRQKNLEQAIHCFTLALEILTQEAFPVEWATTQNNLGLTYSQLPGGDRQKNLEQAIHCFTLALEARNREAFPRDWAMTQNNLGSAYAHLPGGDRQKNLEQAIHCYTLALNVLTREAFPLEWSTMENNLGGGAYSQLPGGDRQKNLEQAIRCYTQALEIRNREAFPRDWAGTQNNLGLAYSNLPAGDRQKNLEQSIYFYTQALEVYTHEDFPRHWAGTQNNLEQAIHCYTQALEVYTHEAFPVEWAMTQDNLGIVYREMTEGDRQANLEQAIHYFTCAFEVLTREAFPLEWAEIQHNLGNIYGELPGTDQQKNLEQAIHYLSQVLEVFTREDFPLEWSTTQNDLGNIYKALPEGDRKTNLERAIHSFNLALEVRTREAFPFHWAIVQNNLGSAYWNLPDGDRQKNLEQAIHYFTQTFEVFQSMHMDSYAHEVNKDLKKAQDELQSWVKDNKRE